jgi:hypothetical protein
MGDRVRPLADLGPVAAVAELARRPLNHRLLDEALGVGRQAAAEDDVAPAAQLLDLGGDLRRLAPLGVVGGGIADGA